MAILKALAPLLNKPLLLQKYFREHGSLVRGPCTESLHSSGYLWKLGSFVGILKK